MHSSTGSDYSSRSSEAKLFGIKFSDLHVSKESSGVVNSNANSSKRNTSLMKTLLLCYQMSPLLLTRRSRRPFGYVKSGNLRGSRIELGI